MKNQKKKEIIKLPQYGRFAWTEISIFTVLVILIIIFRDVLI